MKFPNWFKMLDDESVELLIYDYIAKGVIDAALIKAQLDKAGNVKTIKIRINSAGGSVFEGFAIYNLLKEHKAQKEVYVDGYAASIASIIAMAGNKIIMPENTYLFIHNPWTCSCGDSVVLRADADQLDRLKKDSVKIYKSQAKELSYDDISKIMDDGTWVSANDALTYGFATDVIETIEVKSLCPVKMEMNFIVPVDIEKHILSFEPAKEESKDSINDKKFLNSFQGVNAMKCPKCGKDHDANAKFCADCGYLLATDPESIKKAHEKEVAEAKNQARLEQRNRDKAITDRCAQFNLPREFTNKLIDSDKPIDVCITEILDEIDKNKNLNPSGHQISVGREESEKMREGIFNSVCVAAGLEKNPQIVADVRKHDLPRNLHGLVKTYLREEKKLSDRKIDNLTSGEIGSEAIRMAAAGTADFPSILADVANKSMAKGFAEAPVTYSLWGSSMDVPDFKTANVVKMSNFSDVDKIPEGMNFKMGKFSDKHEHVSVDTYGKAFSLSRQAFVNDDLNALSRVPAAMSGAQNRNINKIYYDTLCSNSLVGPTMNEDSVALFNNASHNNLEATSGVPTIALIAAAEKCLLEMPLMKPENNSSVQHANLPAKYIITGTINKLVVSQLLLPVNSQIYATTSPDLNIYRGLLTPIFDPYLGYLTNASSKPYTWYLAVDPGQLETIGVAYLNGNRTPTVRSETSRVTEALGITYDMYFDAGIYVADYRGIVMSDGD